MWRVACGLSLTIDGVVCDLTGPRAAERAVPGCRHTMLARATPCCPVLPCVTPSLQRGRRAATA